MNTNRQKRSHEAKIEEIDEGRRWIYEYDELTPKGERVVVELCRCENPGGKNSIPALWCKHGYTSTMLDAWWSVQTYVYDHEGNCWGRYNPTLMQKAPKPGTTDFRWILSATEANRGRLLREIERRAFDSASRVNHEEA